MAARRRDLEAADHADGELLLLQEIRELIDQARRVPGVGQEVDPRLAVALERFLGDPTAARTMAATLICTVFGYAFLFMSLDLQSVADVNRTDIIQLLAQGMSANR